MNDIRLINGKLSDGEWLYDLYKKTMKSYIKATWSWDEDFQRNGFNKNLKPTDWKILKNDIEAIGGYVVREKHDSHVSDI